MQHVTDLKCFTDQKCSWVRRYCQNSLGRRRSGMIEEYIDRWHIETDSSERNLNSSRARHLCKTVLSLKLTLIIIVCPMQCVALDRI